ncbi:DUF2953 domain-containing protein [Paenibacillus psychroresistens]|nr:DUF2953 domain-containing protein [Paenibacillus psychroresistens]
MIWLWLVIFLVVVMVGLGLSRLRVHIFFSRVKDNDHFFVHLKLLGGLISYKMDVPILEYRGLFGGFAIKMKSILRITKKEMQPKKQKEQFTPERISDIYRWGRVLLAHVREFTSWLHHMLTHVKCTEFRWNTRLGIGDAAETALATGMLWAVKSTLFGYIFQYVHLEAKPKLSIQPQYNHPEFSTEFSCHASIRIGYLFYSMLVLLWRIMKSKGGLKTWGSVIFRAQG